jgi:hypothetical protein
MLASLFVIALFPFAQSCSATNDSRLTSSGNNGTGSAQGGSTGELTGGPGSGGSSAIITCEDAADAHSYIGCDFWPTVTANNVWSLFDFAVVVANASPNSVDATVTQGGAMVATQTIAPNSLGTIYLPWVQQLKGPDADMCGAAMPVAASVKVPDGAYHLTTTAPVTVYQFNALEYAPQGGPPGKQWSPCPGDSCPVPTPCFSYSNDASLLLPSTALTPNARVAGYQGWATANIGSFIAVTGTEDGTSVDVLVSQTGSLVAGGGINGAGPGQATTFTLNAGEVAQLIGTPTSDLSGSLVKANKPVQVIVGMPCTNVPDDFTQACDHIEESMFPAETLGQHYFVARPQGPLGSPVGHVVKIYGNVDGTGLSYPSGMPPGAPGSIDAGQVVNLGVVNQDFEVQGTAAFAVGSFTLGGTVVDPGGGLGDPDHSLAVAVEQYRTRYIFLAPTDYDVNYLMAIHPNGAMLTLDGMPAGGTPSPIGSGFSISRIQLGDGNNGAHELTADQPVGIQVTGYGLYTSYYYPGGSDLLTIAPPPLE